MPFTHASVKAGTALKKEKPSHTAFIRRRLAASGCRCSLTLERTTHGNPVCHPCQKLRASIFAGLRNIQRKSDILAVAANIFLSNNRRLSCH